MDDAFDHMEHRGNEPAGEGTMQADRPTRQEVEALFRKIAAEHARHLRDFAVELSAGVASKQWAELCSASLRTLRRAADTMGDETLSRALEGLENAMDAAKQTSQPRIEGAARARLLSHYAILEKVVPEAFAYKADRDRREPIVVDTLLQLTPGVHRLVIDKLYAAGLTSLSKLYDARAEEIAQATGVALPICEAIAARFASYRRERTDAVPDEDRSQERSQLKTLLADLRGRQSAFREAEAREDSRQRREARKARERIVRQAQLVLARLGETQLIDELSRLPVDRKIARIDRYLAQPPGHAGVTAHPA